MNSDQIVPGDIIDLSNVAKMPCDAILISGQALMNEATLTGESLPVMKNALPSENEYVHIKGMKDSQPLLYDPDEHGKFTLFSGTEVIQTRNFNNSRIHGLVIRTGFQTIKGSLVKSILFPKPHDFKFYSDSIKFVGVMAMFAVVGDIIAAPYLLKNDSWFRMVDSLLDMVTITVPPALPAILTISVIFGLSRL